MASSLVFADRDQPGQSSAEAKTFLAPASMRTARRAAWPPDVGLTRRG